MSAGSAPPAALHDAGQLIAPLFARQEARRRAADYVAGLLSAPGRKNAWRLAERAGHAGPDGLQWLLNGASWSADALRDVVRDHVHSALAAPDAVLAFDATGFAKRGTMSAGVARQFDPRSGRMANCQVAAFAGYVTGRGCALVDRELCLPPEWAADPVRCARAGVPTGHPAAPSALAARMLRRCLAAGIRPAWVVGDERGDTGELRTLCEELALPHIIEVTPGHPVASAPGRPPLPAAEIAALAPRRGYRSPAVGSDRERAVLRLGVAPGTGLVRVLLVRRYRSRTRTATYHLGQAHVGAAAAELAAAVDARAGLAACLELARERAGLDHYEVRKWDAWYRHVSLSMFALAVLVTSGGTAPPAGPAAGGSPVVSPFAGH